MMLNARLVGQLIEERGLKKIWVIEQIGLKRSAGCLMINDGLLPKDPQIQKKALEKLAAILGVEVRQILLRLEGQRKSA